ncbi:MAG TPA: disulfide bond formation protein DsbD [Bacteroidales bacterium]|nr:disulfide bond formation protein DsbD [Bacteroidales bacterium]
MLLSLFFATIVNSQVLEPIKISHSYKQKDNIVTISFTAKCDSGWHIYSHYLDEGGPIPTNIVIEKSPDYELYGNIIESKKPHTEFDKNFNMELAFFSNQVTFSQKIKVISENDFIIKGYIEYMACNDETCIPPAEYDFEISVKGYKKQVPKNTATLLQSLTPDTNSKKQDTLLANTNNSNFTDTQNDSVKKDSSGITQTEYVDKNTANSEHHNLWWFFFISFLAGLLAIITPCVFPMIPMTVSFFMHNNKNKIRGRIEALTYGISIILIYTFIGTIIALTLGPNFANFLSTHWLPNISFFLIFLIFAASFFGMFEITLPGWLIDKSDKGADKGGLIGAFFMAFTLVLVSFSCTGPIVGAILVESAGGMVLKPIIGMFGFSLAFAIPFTLFAFFPQWLENLPKSGGWLNSVKIVLGFLELALGLKFLSIADQTYHWHILDREVYLALWIVIFALLGFYLLGKLRFKHDTPLESISVYRLMLAIITFSFVIYMIPGMWGAPLKALSGYLPPQSSIDFDMERIVRENSTISSEAKPSSLCEKPKYADFLELPHGLEGYFDYKQGVACGKQQGKPIFIDFTGHGCVNCRKMEASVWISPRIIKHLRNDFIVMALYVDDKKMLPESEWIKSDYDGKIKKTIGKINADKQISEYNINAQPYYVLLDPYDEKPLVEPKTYDLNIDNFADFLEAGLKEFYRKHPDKKK